MSEILSETKAKLAEYKKLIDDDLAEYSKELSKDILKNYNSPTHDMVSAYFEVLSRGGKRLRGALTMHAYFMAGGEDRGIALKAARAIEMIHAYLLIIDDITDKSDSRRGGPAAHRLLEKYHQDKNLSGNSQHFGTSQAMHAALFGVHKAIEEIMLLSMDERQKNQAMQQLSASLVTTIAGQLSDVYNEALREASEESVRQVLTWKTAYYSFLNPLQFGVLLAGKSWQGYGWLEDYAVHAGLAFQITDDILGVFADEAKSGKSTLDDLREGKATLLVAKTLKRANSQQKKQFLEYFGKHDMTQKEQQIIQEIMKTTEALKETKETAENEAEKAIFALSEAPEKLQKDVRFLDGIALYITNRKS